MEIRWEKQAGVDYAGAALITCVFEGDAPLPGFEE